MGLFAFVVWVMYGSLFGFSCGSYYTIFTHVLCTLNSRVQFLLHFLPFTDTSRLGLGLGLGLGVMECFF